MPVVGQTLHGTLVSYTPWFPRPDSATSAVFAVYVIKKGGSGTINVEVFSRNNEDTDTGGSSLGSITGGAQGPATDTIYKASIDGLKEMIRLKITIGGSSTDWIHFAVLHPTFYVKKT
jgi:hypothetical protein